MGGLMAAEVLSRFFEEVLVLEKDALPAQAEVRMGVPQGAHVHSLLVQGRRNLERMFPGLASELIDRGVVCSRGGLEFMTNDEAGWFPRRDIQLPLMLMSRPLLEGAVRDFLKRNARVTIRENTRVEGWTFDGDILVGVVGSRGDAAETIPADFVVDATGRSGNSLSWLEAGGFGPIEETRLEIGTGYASAVFKKPPNWHGAVDGLSISNRDPDTKGGFLFSIENDCWLASLTGRFDQQPPGDPDKFMAFAQSLCVPDFYNWISKGERISPVKVYKAPISRWRRFEKLVRQPERLLPLGDALAHVNPIFGQGVTLASAHVMSLWNVLAERVACGGDLNGVARPYFEKVHSFTKTVWENLESVEYRYACTKGERPVDIDMRIAYSRGLRKLVEDDAEVHRLMGGVAHLIHPLEAIRRPDIVARVMRIMQTGTTAATAH